jgi:hypothetical protein
MFLLSHDVYSSIDYPGAISTGGSAVAGGINPRGDIVGQYMDGSGVTHGFVLDAGGYRTVDTPGHPTTVLTGINPQGDIVGRCRVADGRDVAFVIQC